MGGVSGSALTSGTSSTSSVDTGSGSVGGDTISSAVTITCSVETHPTCPLPPTTSSFLHSAGTSSLTSVGSQSSVLQSAESSKKFEIEDVEMSPVSSTSTKDSLSGENSAENLFQETGLATPDSRSSYRDETVRGLESASGNSIQSSDNYTESQVSEPDGFLASHHGEPPITSMSVYSSPPTSPPTNARSRTSAAPILSSQQTQPQYHLKNPSSSFAPPISPPTKDIPKDLLAQGFSKFLFYMKCLLQDPQMGDLLHHLENRFKDDVPDIPPEATLTQSQVQQPTSVSCKLLMVCVSNRVFHRWKLHRMTCVTRILNFKKSKESKFSTSTNSMHCACTNAKSMLHVHVLLLKVLLFLILVFNYYAHKVYSKFTSDTLVRFEEQEQELQEKKRKALQDFRDGRRHKTSDGNRAGDAPHARMGDAPHTWTGDAPHTRAGDAPLSPKASSVSQPVTTTTTSVSHSPKMSTERKVKEESLSRPLTPMGVLPTASGVLAPVSSGETLRAQFLPSISPTHDQSVKYQQQSGPVPMSGGTWNQTGAIIRGPMDVSSYYPPKYPVGHGPTHMFPPTHPVQGAPSQEWPSQYYGTPMPIHENMPYHHLLHDGHHSNTMYSSSGANFAPQHVGVANTIPVGVANNVMTNQVHNTADGMDSEQIEQR